MWVFLLLDWLPNQSKRNQAALLVTHSWKKNRLIYFFHKGIGEEWDANSFVKDLKAAQLIHFVKL